MVLVSVSWASAECTLVSAHFMAVLGMGNPPRVLYVCDLDFECEGSHNIVGMGTPHIVGPHNHMPFWTCPTKMETEASGTWLPACVGVGDGDS